MSVQVFNVETLQTVARLPVSTDIALLAFSRDGRTLLTWAIDQTKESASMVTFWRVSDGSRMATCPVRIPRWLDWNQIAVAPDLSLAAFGTDKLELIDLSTGKVRWSVTNDNSRCEAVVFSADGRVLVSSQGGDPMMLCLRDVVTGNALSVQPTPQRGVAKGLVAWPDRNTLASGSMGGTIQLWDLIDGQVRARGRPLRGQFSGIGQLALLPGGKTLLSAGMDGSVFAWDTTLTRSNLGPITLPGVYDAEFASDGKMILSVDTQGQISQRLGQEFQVKVPLLELGTDAADVDFSDWGTDFSDGGARWFAGTWRGVLHVWDLQTRTPARQVTVPGGLLNGVFGLGSRQLFACDPAKELVHVWDLNTLQEVMSWHLGAFSTLAMSTDGKWFLSVTFGGVASLREVDTGRSTNWNSEVALARTAVFSPDAKRFAISGMNGYARVWETAAPLRLVASVGDHQLPIACVNFSPDGRCLVTTGGEREAVTLWDLDTEKELITLAATGTSLGWAKFSPDGNVLSAASADKRRLYLWRAPAWTDIDAAEQNKALDKAALRLKPLPSPDSPGFGPLAPADLQTITSYLFAEGKFLEVEDIFQEALTRPAVSSWEKAAVLSERGQLRARSGRWQEAIADFTQVAELEPDDAWAYYCLAPLLVQSGNREGYQSLCARIRERFAGTTNDLDVADKMARACLILPAQASADLSTERNWADIAVTIGKGTKEEIWYQFCKGLAEYRQGNFASSMEEMRTVLGTPELKRSDFGPEPQVGAEMVLAMAQYRLDQIDAARATFAKGAELAAANLRKIESGDIGSSWKHWIIAHALMREAKALIEDPSKPNGQSR